jgi:TolA-binding protein
MGERATEADAHFWLGKIAAEQGDENATDREFSLALEHIAKLNLTERLVRAHAEYAEILEERGDVAGANQQLKQVLALSRPDLISAGIREERKQQLA